MMTKVTVIVPCREEELNRCHCYESLAGQTLTGTEILAEPAKGPMEALLSGSRRASGQYVMLAYPEDSFRLPALEDLYQIAESDFVLGGSYHIFPGEKGSLELRCSTPLAYGSRDTGVTTPRQRAEVLLRLASSRCLMIRRDYLLEQEFACFCPDMGDSGEELLLWELLLGAGTIRVLNRPVHRTPGKELPEKTAWEDFAACSRRYGTIRKVLMEHPGRTADFKAVFWSLRFAAEREVMLRLAPGERIKALRFMSKELCRGDQMQEIRQEFFDPELYHEMLLIRNDPKGYQYRLEDFEETEKGGLAAVLKKTGVVRLLKKNKTLYSAAKKFYKAMQK